MSTKAATRALTGSRQLVEQFEAAGMYWHAADKKWKPIPSANIGSFANWKTIASHDLPMFYNEGYYDLSGYELDNLTLAPISIDVQDPGVYLFSGTDQVFCVYDMLTTERLTEDDIDLLSDNNRINRQQGPGMPEGPLDRDQIIFGLYRFFAHNSTQTGMANLMLNARTVRFGSGEPTTVQKLWAYRIVIFADSPADSTETFIPACNFVLNAEIFKEESAEYLMRQKRSYELATGN